jgi:dienelactone hydrolase
MSRIRFLYFVLVVAFTPAFQAAAGQSFITEQFEFDTNSAAGVKPARIKATLYLPSTSKPVAAMVIISSSGGVLDWIEGYYAKELSRSGIAGFVVGSFRPRGVTRVIEDQSLVTSWDMENDAFAALSVLRKDKRIDPTRIGIMGLSKGGLVAENSAFIVRQKWRNTGELAFSAHVAIAPDCAAQHSNASTTGKPIFYMLAELDDYNLAKPCVEYVDRIKASGNPGVTLKVYKGAHHNWEDVRPVSLLARAENYSTCSAIIDDNGEWVMAAGKGPSLMKAADIYAWRRANCMTVGAHVGGGSEALKREASRDLLAFLRGHGF